MVTRSFEQDEWLRQAVAGDDAARFHSASFVRGVSLSGVLQMLHLERKTCVLEVISDGRFGTLTLVNGELVDAGTDELDGEEAVYRILAWPAPRTTILDGVNLFRHSVRMPISRLLVELVRRQDESLAASDSARVPEPEAEVPDSAAQPASGWDRLAESLVIGGAIAAAVVEADGERVVASSDERGGSFEGLSAAALAEMIPATAGLRDWLRDARVDDVVAKRNGLQLLIAPLDPDHARYAYALADETDALDRLRACCRQVTAV